MRTTVVIPDDLKKKARRVADERGVSLSELIRESLKETVNKSPRRFRFIATASVGGGFGRRSGEEPAIPEHWR